MLIAVLKKKSLLSQDIYDYINEYWEDIIYLVNHPDSESQIQVEIVMKEDEGQEYQPGLIQS